MDKEANRQIFASPVVYQGIVFVTYSTDLFAFQVQTGVLRWSYTPEENRDDFTVVQPVVAGGLILTAAPASKVYAINP